MPLLELLFDNLFFLLLLFGFLWSLAQRRKKQRQEQSGRRMPSFGDGPDPWGRQGTDGEKRQSKLERSAREAVETAAGKRTYKESRTESAATRVPAVDLNLRVESVQPAPREPMEASSLPRHSSSRRGNSRIQIERALDAPPAYGMIWAEIFGPPRSKNPHRRRPGTGR